MLKRISIDIDGKDKDKLVEICNRRSITLKDAFLALFDEWLSMDDMDAIKKVLDYRQRQVERLNKAMRNRAPVIGEMHDVIDEETGEPK